MRIYGGTGLIGSAVVRRLVARGILPLVLARGKHPVKLPAGVKFEAIDRSDGKALLKLFQDRDVDTVIDIFALGLKNTGPMLEGHGRDRRPLCAAELRRCPIRTMAGC